MSIVSTIIVVNIHSIVTLELSPSYDLRKKIVGK